MRLLCLLLLSLLAAACQAHEVRPASLDISEDASGALHIRWRQPINGEYAIVLRPHLSSGWLESEPQQVLVSATALTRQWLVLQPDQPLAGQELVIEGLDRTITDVLLTLTARDGKLQSRLIKADQPRLVLPANGEGSAVLLDYLWLGFTHIWSGPDHLLYVLGLVLLIHSRRALLLTITAFTLAHSLTLAGATLGLVHLRPAPVEAVIALSIVYVAVELVRAGQAQASLAQRWPWLIAFVFGLLHGFGFAGALQEIGLPQQAVALALLLFNLGIELGQLLFVAALLISGAACFRWVPHSEAWLRRWLPLGIGSLASCWMLQRLAVLW